MHPALFHLKLFVTSCCLCLDEPQTRSPAPLMATHCSLPPGLSFHVILWRDFPTSQSELALLVSLYHSLCPPTRLLFFVTTCCHPLIKTIKPDFLKLKRCSGDWEVLRECEGVYYREEPVWGSLAFSLPFFCHSSNLRRVQRWKMGGKWNKVWIEELIVKSSGEFDSAALYTRPGETGGQCIIKGNTRSV